MRFVAALFVLVAFALATIVVQGGTAMAMDQMSDTTAMAGMNMGNADVPACPPKVCDQMNACAAIAVTLESLVNDTDFVPSLVPWRLVQLAPSFYDPVPAYGLRRPPRSI